MYKNIFSIQVSQISMSLIVDPYIMELIKRTNVSRSGDIPFQPIGKSGGYRKPQTVLKREGDQLKFSESKVARDTVEQFKTLLEETVEPVEERRIRQDNEEALINTNVEHTDTEFPGLTDQEKREMDGILNPPEGQSVKERAFVLGIENNHLREKMAREEPGERLQSLEKYLALIERAHENLAVRESQEKDITRFQKIKKWLKENLVGLSTVGISIAGIITTIIMAGRKALVKGGQVLGTFVKAVANVLKSLVPVLTLILNVLAMVLSWA